MELYIYIYIYIYGRLRHERENNMKKASLGLDVISFKIAGEEKNVKRELVVSEVYFTCHRSQDSISITV